MNCSEYGRLTSGALPVGRAGGTRTRLDRENGGPVSAEERPDAVVNTASELGARKQWLISGGHLQECPPIFYLDLQWHGFSNRLKNRSSCEHSHKLADIGKFVAVV
ncbi:hypothetical protein ACFLV3_06420 [Chloroflexota bacterium]